jgi:hypothetical protein
VGKLPADSRGAPPPAWLVRWSLGRVPASVTLRGVDAAPEGGPTGTNGQG